MAASMNAFEAVSVKTWDKEVDIVSLYRMSFEVSLSLSLSCNGTFSILVVSCFMWSAALDSSGILLSYTIKSLAKQISTILISTLF